MTQLKVIMAAVAAVILSSCSRFASQNQVGWEDVEQIGVDSVAYDGYCLQGTTDQTLKMVTANGDTLYFNMADVKKKKQVFGTINPGDEIYVMLSSDSNEVRMVVNKSALLGKWVQPDPIDGSSDIGIEIKIGGDAKSYAYPESNNEVEYVSWRLFNGKMVIEERRDDGLSESEMRKFTIIKITPDSLILRADDDNEAPFNFGRWKENHEYDDLPEGLEIDDGSSDEIIW